MIVRKLSEAKAYDAPNHRKYESLRIFGAEMGGSQGLIFGCRTSSPAAAPAPTPRRRRRSITFSKAN